MKRKVIYRRIPIPVRGKKKKSSGTKIINSQLINVSGYMDEDKSSSSSETVNCYSHSTFASHEKTEEVQQYEDDEDSSEE